MPMNTLSLCPINTKYGRTPGFVLAPQAQRSLPISCIAFSLSLSLYLIFHEIREISMHVGHVTFFFKAERVVLTEEVTNIIVIQLIKTS